MKGFIVLPVTLEVIVVIAAVIAVTKVALGVVLPAVVV